MELSSEDIDALTSLDRDRLERRMGRSTCVALLLLAIQVLPVLGQQHDHAAGSTEVIGRVTFPTSCDRAVQPELERAVAMLHSFWYEKAEATFNAIASKAPECAIAHWGVAMSNYHPLWVPPTPAELQRGAAAASRAMAATQATPRERAYVEAIEQFYRDAPATPHATRALAYESTMVALRSRYPRDDEAAAFTALAILGAAAVLPSDPTYARQKRAAALLNGVAGRHPSHPGIAHYFIHAYDSPELASLALPAAHSYARVAPSVPHALHMPSHIFTRLGRWENAITSNVASAKAARDFAESSGMNGAWDQELHGLDYLMYAYLQGGQDARAREVLDRITSVTKVAQPGLIAGYALATAPARYVLERHDWPAAVGLTLTATPIPWQNARWAESNVYYAVALGAAHSGNLDRARAEVAHLDAIYREVAGKDKYAGLIDAQRRAAAAWVAQAEGKSGEALELARGAADLEESIEKHPVTPGMVLPARELLGDLLLEQHQPAAALQAYRATLKHSPGRFNSIAGAMRAAEESGDRVVARRYATELLRVTANATAARPEIAAAKRLVARR